MNINRSFRSLWMGQSLANFADSLYILAVVMLVFRTTGSTILSALIPVIRLSAMLISGFFAPLVMDRFRLWTILFFSQGTQTLLLLILSINMITKSSHPLAPVCSFIALTSFFDGWSTPARNAIVPRIVPKERLVTANGLLSSTDQIVLLVGWGLGGLLVEWLGANHVLWFSVIFLALSTFSLLWVHDPASKGAPASIDRSKWTSAKEGWHYLFSHPVLKRLALMDIFDYTASSVWAGAIILTYVVKVLHREEAWWGFINGIYFAGTMIGGLLVIRFAEALKRKFLAALAFGGGTMSLLTVVYALNSLPVLSLLVCFFMGPPSQAKEIAKRTIYQTETPQETLPKVFAAQNMLSYLSFGLAVLWMGWVADHVSVRGVYISAALFYGVSTLVATTLKSGHAPYKKLGT
ncbi:MAG: MFS transporter [Thermoactinomyces sp.]